MSFPLYDDLFRSFEYFLLLFGSHACMLSCFSHVQLFAALWNVACQAPLSMGFSRHEYWSGLPFPSLGDLPHPGIDSASLMSPALAGGFFTSDATREHGFNSWSGN